MTKSFSLNANVSAKNSVLNGSVGFNMIDNFTESDNNLTFIFRITRDFGDTLVPLMGLDPSFTNAVVALRSRFQGEALFSEISSRYGSHYMLGFHSAAEVLVIYTFQFDSATVARSWALNLSTKYSSGVNQATFTTDIKSTFNSTDTKVRLNYQFYSSDSSQTPSFSLTGQISSYDEFQAFADKVQAYAGSLSPANAKLVSYIVEPIQNLPGLSPLIDYYNPPAILLTDYDRFLEVFSTLKRWEAQLFDWTVDSRRMNWLNQVGQKNVIAARTDLATHLRGLKEQAEQHFLHGTPLIVPESTINYLATANRMLPPSLGVVFAFGAPTCDLNAVIGIVNCGPKQWATTNAPFLNVVFLSERPEEPVPVEFSADAFEAYMSAHANPSCYGDQVALIRESSTWQSLKRQAEDCKIGFFWIGANPAQVTTSAIGLKDGTGRFIDLIRYTTRMTANACGSGAESSPASDLGLKVQPFASKVTFTFPATYSIVISNAGPGAAQAVVARLSLDPGAKLLSVRGSQGRWAADTDALRYDVGSIASGGVVTIQADLGLSGPGRIETSGAITLDAVNGGQDTDLSNNAARIPGFEVLGIPITAKRSGWSIELGWTVGGSEVKLEAADDVDSFGKQNTAYPVLDVGGGQRRVIVPSTSQRSFFRLTSQ